MKLISYRELAGQIIKSVHESYELYILCESGNLAILNYGDERGFHDERLDSAKVHTIKWLAKKNNFKLDYELLVEINEMESTNKRFELRDYIASKIKFERNTDKFNWWKIIDIMDTYTDPIQHIEEIINKVLENYEEPEASEGLEE